MNHFLRGFAQASAETFLLPEPILEIGSYQVEGQEEVNNLRSLFPGKRYQGLDMRPGPGVDLVGNVEQMDLATASVGTVIALSTLEHVEHFWKGFDEIYRVLRPDGALILSCPFYFHIHSYPSDYWRFTPEALRLLLKKYPSKILGWHGPTNRPASVWAIAFREEHPGATPEQYEKYRHLMARYAYEPCSWWKNLRYLMGRVVSGRRPFAPYLDRNKWETIFLTDVAKTKKDRVRATMGSAA